MCPTQIKLEQQRAAAELAYRSAIARSKEARGKEFERAWQLAEHRRQALQLAGHLLQRHQQDHLCENSGSLMMAGSRGTAASLRARL